jgi:hypothetical protein
MKKPVFCAVLCALSMMPIVAPAADGTAFSGNLMIWPQWGYVKTSGMAVVTAAFPGKILDQSHTTGTNANQMNALVVESGTLTNGASREFSLLACTNVFGDSIAFDRVNVFGIKASTANNGIIKMAAATNSINASILGSFDFEVIIRPGGTAFFTSPDATGFAVGTNAHQVKILNGSTNTAVYELYIGGAQ